MRADGRWTKKYDKKMDAKTVALLERTFVFGIRILKFVNTLPDNIVYRIPKGQLGRSAPSIGSNYEEAQGAVSKRDFNNKIGICYKEARESVYWVRVLSELYPEDEYKKDFSEIIQEATELRKIFSSIRKSGTDNL